MERLRRLLEQTRILCIARIPSFPPWQGGMKEGFRYAISENALMPIPVPMYVGIRRDKKTARVRRCYRFLMGAVRICWASASYRRWFGPEQNCPTWGDTIVKLAVPPLDTIPQFLNHIGAWH